MVLRNTMLLLKQNMSLSLILDKPCQAVIYVLYISPDCTLIMQLSMTCKKRRGICTWFAELCGRFFLENRFWEFLNTQAFVTHGNRWHRRNQCSVDNFLFFCFWFCCSQLRKHYEYQTCRVKDEEVQANEECSETFFCCSSEMWLFRQWIKWCWWENGCYSRQEGTWWKAEGTMADAVDIVEWNLLNLLTVKHDKVIFEDEEGVLCDEHQSLFLIVPMINSTQ